MAWSWRLSSDFHSTFKYFNFWIAPLLQQITMLWKSGIIDEIIMGSMLCIWFQSKSILISTLHTYCICAGVSFCSTSRTISYWQLQYHFRIYIGERCQNHNRHIFLVSFYLIRDHFRFRAEGKREFVTKTNCNIRWIDKQDGCWRRSFGYSKKIGENQIEQWCCKYWAGFDFLHCRHRFTKSFNR